MEIKLITNINVKDYDTHAIHPLQSWAWGEARKKMGIEVLRIGEFDHSSLRRVFQITIHKIPNTSFKIGYLPRSEFPSNRVLKFIYDYGKKNNIIFFKIEPYLNKSQFSILNFQSNFKFIKSEHPLFPEWTQILDLTKSEDKLLKNMHHKTRYNIGLAQKKGVYVKEESTDRGFEIFSQLYFDTCKRQKYFGHTLNYHKTIWNYLKNDIAHILIAYYKKIPLAAYELFYFNQVFYYPYGGTSQEFRNLMGSNLLMWEAVKLGKKMGARKFDMWGSLPSKYKLNNPWAGFTRFKQGYGGQFINLAGSWDLVITPYIYSLYSIANKIRSFYLNLIQ